MTDIMNINDYSGNDMAIYGYAAIQHCVAATYRHISTIKSIANSAMIAMIRMIHEKPSLPDIFPPARTEVCDE